MHYNGVVSQDLTFHVISYSFFSASESQLWPDCRCHSHREGPAIALPSGAYLPEIVFFSAGLGVFKSHLLLPHPFSTAWSCVTQKRNSTEVSHPKSHSEQGEAQKKRKKKCFPHYAPCNIPEWRFCTCPGLFCPGLQILKGQTVYNCTEDDGGTYSFCKRWSL